MTAKRRVASSRVYLDDNLLGLYVVETKGKLVERYYALTEELPFTEWLQGEIFLQTGANGTVTVKETTCYAGQVNPTTVSVSPSTRNFTSYFPNGIP